MGIAAAKGSNPTKILIFPLNAFNPSQAISWLSEGIAGSLSSQIVDRGLNVISRNERVHFIETLDLPPGVSLSRGSMIRVAQRASADLLVLGSYTGTDKNLKIALRVLDVKELKLSGEMVANGPLSALPQMENELAWLILNNMGFGKDLSRTKFQERMRKVPNLAYAFFIQGLDAPGENSQMLLLQKAVEAYHNFPEARYQLGTIYFQKEEYDKAIPHLMAGCNEGNSSIECRLMLGTCYLQRNQPLEAIQVFLQLLQLSRSLEALNNLGVAYLRKGDPIAARDVLLEAKNIIPADATISLNLGIARHMEGRDWAAAEIVENAVKAYPQNGMLQFMLGFLLKKKGDNEKAAAAFYKAKNLGVNVDKLQLEDPRTWSKVYWVYPAKTID
jgi:tetratricopeptide (TPR) repeat protein